MSGLGLYIYITYTVFFVIACSLSGDTSAASFVTFNTDEIISDVVEVSEVLVPNIDLAPATTAELLELYDVIDRHVLSINERLAAGGETFKLTLESGRSVEYKEALFRAYETLYFEGER